MKKTVFLFLLISLSILLLSSCGAREKQTTPAETTSPPPEEITVFDGSGSLVLVLPKNGGSDVRAEAMNLRSLISVAVGTAPTMSVDSTEPTGREIAFGNTARPISAAAAERIASYVGDTETGAYVIYESGGSLAIVGNCDDALHFAVKHFGETYLTAGVLTVPKGLADVGTFSLTEYYEYLEEQQRLAEEERRQKEAEAFQNRFDAIEQSAGKELADAFRELFDFYGTDTILWLAGLWEPEIGGFYYANSARDYEGFLPDLESTYQAIGLLRSTGAFVRYENDPAKALPSGMIQKIVNFTKALEDPDGYFYHPQWGKSIGSSRRGRDLSWGIAILNWFGEKPPYPTALDRLSGTTLEMRHVLRTYLAETAESASEPTPKKDTSGLPEYLQSEAAFIAYLDTLNIKKDSHSTGHTLSSIKNQIQAAGLIDVCCDYLDRIQEEVQQELIAAGKQPNGLWQTEVNYTSLSGLFKIGAIYNDANRPMRYAAEMVDSALEAAMLDTDPSIIIYVYNPLAALNTVIANMKAVNASAPGTYDLDALVYAKSRAIGVELIEKTIEKLSLFQKPDGSFSYNQKSSAPYTQGTPVSLGYDEGDVNATALALNGLCGSLFSSLGVTRVPTYYSAHYEAFLEIIEAAKAPVKKGLINEKPEDFESETALRVLDGNGCTSIVTDPKNADNHALETVSSKGKGDGFTFSNLSGPVGHRCYRFESRFNLLESTGAAYAFQIRFGQSSSVYMITFTVRDGRVCIDDNATTANSEKVTDLGISVPLGEWFTLAVEYYPAKDPADARFKIYLNGECRAISSNFYGSQNVGASIADGFYDVYVYAMKNAAVRLLLDDMSVTSFEDKTFDDSDLVTGGVNVEPTDPDAGRSVTYPMDEKGEGYTENLGRPNTRAEIVSDPADPSNRVLQLNKTDIVMNPIDELIFASPTRYRAGDTITVSFRFYIDRAEIKPISGTDDGKSVASLNHTLLQICFGGVSAGEGEGVYMLTLSLSADGTSVKIGDAISIAGGKTTSLADGLALDAWHTVTVSLNLKSEPSEFLASVSVDGGPAVTSTNYYNYARTDGKAANTGFSSIRIRPQARVDAVVCFDDLSMVLSGIE